jgi:hypothetical protein
MAHPWRIEYEGALYHVFSRSNNQQDIFVTDDEYKKPIFTISVCGLSASQRFQPFGILFFP